MPLKHYGALGGWRPWILDIPIDIQHSINLAYLQLNSLTKLLKILSKTLTNTCELIDF